MIIDLLDYIRGDGRGYILANNWSGGNEICHTINDGRWFKFVKNRNYEHFYYNDDIIGRGLDTSPGGDEVYLQYTGDLYGAAWIKRHMKVGETYTRDPKVIWRTKSSGDLIQHPPHKAPQVVSSSISLVSFHDQMTFDSGITIDGVAELQWSGGERYFYGHKHGLVGWEYRNRKSWISDHVSPDYVHQPEQLGWFEQIVRNLKLERDRFTQNYPDLPPAADPRWQPARLVSRFNNVRSSPMVDGRNNYLVTLYKDNEVEILPVVRHRMWHPVKVTDQDELLGWISAPPAVFEIIDGDAQATTPVTEPHDATLTLSRIQEQDFTIQLPEWITADEESRQKFVQMLRWLADTIEDAQ